jgi:uncharacterized protein
MSFHVRRKDREITDPAEMRQILKDTKYVSVALCMNNEPYLVALSHGYDQEKNCVYFHCASEGKKIVFAKANPKVWGQAVLIYNVGDDCDYDYTSVGFEGKLALISDSAEKMHALETLVRQNSRKPDEKLAKLNQERLAKSTMGRIDINYMTGKKHWAKPKQL